MITTPLQPSDNGAVSRTKLNDNFELLEDAIEEVVNDGAPLATSSVKGRSKLSVAPVDADEPIAVGDNDPRLNAVSTPSTPQTNDANKLIRLNAGGQIPRAFVEGNNVQEFSSSGTWTKPISGTMALVECWGAGASGGRASATKSASGGGGGEYTYKFVLLSTLGSTETVTIGAGGAAKTSGVGVGTDGGNTTFGAHVTAYGGKAGDGNDSGDALGGRGGAPYSDGAGGYVYGVGRDSTNFLASNGTYSGGGGAGLFATTPKQGGSSLYGGGGGAGAFNNTVGSGGVSAHAGDGGASSYTAAASAGQTPGGGGGAGVGQNSGAGGAGFCRVTVF